ncbi:MAG: hypothetical protein K9N46_16410 [Candidatus Marinimicrobia bacterium]|nr:hypothetical protein [Candidatus Neomarinimicrobiota bacterium]MCF7827439.1 hypothetical protein [Candidatus Neomarinimicrobiota bacterium]MCF7882314.1 hypothetical protein [Candidatus Neomarinimicrobiota bacterium]
MTLIEIYLVLGFFLGRLAIRRNQFPEYGAPVFVALFRLGIYIFLGITLPGFEQTFMLILAGGLLLMYDLIWMRDGARPSFFLGLLLVLIAFPSLLRYLVEISPNSANPLSDALVDFGENLTLLSAIRSPEMLKFILLVITGFLFTLRESTVLIRDILARISAEPVDQNNQTDEDEYNRGRLIGYLERTLIYFLLVFGYYAGVMFVIAVKSIARYREFKNRDFAEYFLIGTLVSLLLAFIAALYVRLASSLI